MRFLYILLFLNTFVNGQKFTVFPADQHSYLGGNEMFYKDFQKILIAKNLKPCENKKELFRALIIINEDESAALYESDKIPEKNSKCSEELTKEVLKDMNGFVAAKINGEVKAAVAHYYIYPDAFFENFKEGYTPEKFIELPIFEGGINGFRKEVNKRVDTSGFYVKGSEKATLIVRFLVNEEGKIDNVNLENTSGLKEYDEMIISSIQSLKKKWIPAKVHGLPIKYRFRMPISLSAE